MSYFYGAVEGQGKTKATRTGSKKSGVCAEVASERMSARMYMFTNEQGVDCIRVDVYDGNIFRHSYRKVLDSVYRSDMIMFTGEEEEDGRSNETLTCPF